ncbi:DUF6397 family protein, partial [Streptomyces halstedii]|uniref:DUF6397 family protein n=2 Tax=Streptomyces TaxID=1883 RepID=UPI0033524B86
IAERIMTADDPDEIGWLRADLRQTLSEAREDRPAPRPGVSAVPPMPATLQDRPPAPARTTDATDEPDVARSRRLLGWLRRRNADADLPTAP